MAKGQFKRALKDAIVCYRKDPNDEHRQFLEHAYLARAQDLHRLGMRAESRSVVETLLELGTTDPDVKADLPGLLISLGMLERCATVDGSSSLRADAHLLASAADHAVVRPNEVPASMPEIREGASAVRAALEALENGDEPAAVGRLGDIGRSSPFSDWKYFVRGLAAYYRQDTPQMRANWDRLDPTRFASRIAVPLSSLDDSASTDRNDKRTTSAICKIATEVLDGPLLAHLYDLRTQLAAGRWKSVLGLFRKLEQPLREFSPELLERIVMLICPLVVRGGTGRGGASRGGTSSRLADFTSLASPLPMDPNWNRTRALIWEHPSSNDLDKAEEHWLLYLKDLEGLPCLTPTEQTLAQALVWERIGLFHAVQSSPASAPPSVFGSDEDSLDEFQNRAVECFTKSLELAPDLLDVYKSLAALQLAGEQPEQAAETFCRLLERCPENLDALLFLAKHHAMRDEPLLSRPYALRALRLKPTSREIVQTAWSAHVGAARCFALKTQWDEGRREFEAADAVDPSARDKYYLLARRAIFELKARNLDLGEELVQRAQDRAHQPAAALFVLAVESIRYNLTGTARKGFERQWKSALKKRCSGGAAGQMCAIMTSYLIVDVDYPRRFDHLKHLLAYVRRCSRVKWEAEDLRQVCLFLDATSDRPELAYTLTLLDKCVRKGIGKFPNVPLFALLAGKVEMAKGPVECNRPYAIECFEQALELAKQSNDPESAYVIEQAQRQLTFLGEIGSRPLFYDPHDYDDEEDEYYEDEIPFAVPPPHADFDGNGDSFSGVPPRRVFEMFAEACESMGFDPEEVMHDLGMGMPPDLGRSRPPSRRNQRSRRKKKKR